MKKTKRIAVLITTVLTLTALSGCGKTASAGTEKTTADSTVQNSSIQSSTGNESGTSDTTATAGSSALPKNADATTIVAATSGAPNPYIIQNSDGSLGGYDIEVLNAVFDRLPQYNLKYTVTEFGSVLTGITSGQFQIAVNNLSYNKDRAASYLYSYPYDKVSYVFVQKKDATPIVSLSDAGSKKLVMEGDAGVNVTNAVENYNKSNTDAQIKINYTEAGTQVTLQHIEDGTTDFGIIDKAMYVSYVKTYGFNDLQSNDVPADEQAGITDNLYSYFLFAQDNDALRQDVDTVLKELKTDGTLTKIAEKYYSSDQAPEEDKYEKTIN